jgi:uncharacterized membrane protein
MESARTAAGKIQGAASSNKTMPISCPQCHAEMPDNVVFCPGCGRRMWIPGQPTPAKAASKPAVGTAAVSTAAVTTDSPTKHGPLKDKLAAAAAYVTFIPAVIFLLIEPFKRNRFVRFHSSQSIFFTIATILIALAMRGLYSVLALIPVAGYLLAWLTTGILLLGWSILWLVLLIKALQGETFQLPIIGRFAEKI